MNKTNKKFRESVDIALASFASAKTEDYPILAPIAERFILEDIPYYRWYYYKTVPANKSSMDTTEYLVEFRPVDALLGQKFETGGAASISFLVTNVNSWLGSSWYALPMGEVNQNLIPVNSIQNAIDQMNQTYLPKIILSELRESELPPHSGNILAASLSSDPSICELLLKGDDGQYSLYIKRSDGAWVAEYACPSRQEAERHLKKREKAARAPYVYFANEIIWDGETKTDEDRI